MAKHLQLTIRRAKNINACTATKARTMVLAKASYKNIVNTTNFVKDMGQNPVFENDGTNVFHFDYENENEFITLELFNRNLNCIGKSKLHFSELVKLMPEQDPEEKTLPVMISSPLTGYQKQCGELILTAQIKEKQAMGERGNLHVVLQKGCIEGITSIFKSKTTKVCAKLTYKHTTLTSGILKDMGNKFVWHEENKFTFIINSSQLDDVLEIEVFNGSTKVGECKMKMSLLMKEEEDSQAGPKEFVTRTEDLLVNKRAVGSIEVTASFIKFVRPQPQQTMNQRNSYPQTLPSAPPYYPPPHQEIPAGCHVDPHMPAQGHPVRPGHVNRPRSPPLYPPQPPVQHGRPYDPYVPPVTYPLVYSGGPGQVEVHGAPPGRQPEKKAFFQNNPEIAEFIGSYH